MTQNMCITENEITEKQLDYGPEDMTKKNPRWTYTHIPIRTDTDFDVHIEVV